MQKKQYCRALTIAGSDTTGGAGLEADLKSFSALGCYGMAAITTIVDESTVRINGIYDLPANFVASQVNSILGDIGADAVKTGMLSNTEIIEAVAGVLTTFAIKNLVIDPVMVSTEGHKLLKDSAIEAMKGILPMARIITPNHREGEVLLGRKIAEADFGDAARELSREYGGVSVMLKAGHFENPILTDYFYNAENQTLTTLPSPKVHTDNNNGTGCTLSSAITAKLACGIPLAKAVEEAKEYVAGAIISGAAYRLGAGRGPVNHFWNAW